MKNSQEENEDRETYGDSGIVSLEGKVPNFLRWSYWVLLIWGILTLYFYGNGSCGFLDGKCWQGLQVAAKTTFPIIDEPQDVRK